MGRMTTTDGEQIIWRAWEALLTHVCACLTRLGGDGWLVGGCLRDVAALAQRPQTTERYALAPWRDVDLAIQGDPLALARALELTAMGFSLNSPFFLDQFARYLAPARAQRPKAPGLTIVPLTQKTVRITLEPPIFPIHTQLDLSRLTAPTIEGDLARRDYTINALALPLTGIAPLLSSLAQRARPQLIGLIDPLNGMSDLRARRLHTASPTALRDEPGRILRGARFIADFRLTPSDETLWQAHEAAGLLRVVPLPRLRELSQAILARPRILPTLSFLTRAGALSSLTSLRWEDTFTLQRLAIADTPRPQPASPHREEAGATGDAVGVRWSYALSALALTDLWLGIRRLTDVAPACQSLTALRAALRPLLRSQALQAWFGAHFADDAPRLVALRWAMLRTALDMTLALAHHPREQPLTSGSYSGPPYAQLPMPGTPHALTAPPPGAGKGPETGRPLSTDDLPLVTREARHLALRVYHAIPVASALLALGAKDAQDITDATDTKGAQDAKHDILEAPEARMLFDQLGDAAVDTLVAATLLGAVWPQMGAQVGHASLAGRLARRACLLIDMYLATPERLVPPPLLTGSRLIDTLRLAPGPVVGKLLSAIRAEQLAGRLTSESEALAFGSAWLRQERINVYYAILPGTTSAP